MEEEQTDRISDLPNEILRHIMCLLPMESVAQTRLLSTKWRDLWNAKRDHERISVTTTKTVGILVPVYRRGPINSMTAFNYPWNLEFRSHKSRERVLVVTVGVRSLKLHLDFSHGNFSDISSWLACLHLMLTYLPCSTEFCIWSVRLTSVGHLYCDIISSLLSSIRFLESIEITESPALSDISIFGNAKLRHVSIIDCVQVESIHVFADTLDSLRCRGRCPVVFISGPCSLEDIMLDFREGPVGVNMEHGPIKYLFWDASYIEEVEYVTMCQWTFQVLIRPTLSYLLTHLKELWWIDSCMEDENIDSLISFLKLCPNLRNLFVTIDPMCYRLPSNFVHSSYTGRNERREYKEYTHLYNLKMVKMDGFEHEEDEMRLADHLFNLAPKEVAVVASSPNSRSTRRLVKAQPNGWEFVEEIDSNLLNAKHLHMGI